MSRRTTPDDNPGDETGTPGGVPFDDDEDEQEHDMARANLGKAIMREWFRTFEPAPVPARSATRRVTARPPGPPDSSRPGTRSRPPRRGDPHDPGHMDRHMWRQAITPSPLAMLRTLSGPETALGSSIREHQGRAVLGLQDESAAANPSLTSQLRAAPSANPHMSASIADHCAPSGTGQSGATPARPSGPAAYHVDQQVYGQRSAPVVNP